MSFEIKFSVEMIVELTHVSNELSTDVPKLTTIPGLVATLFSI